MQRHQRLPCSGVQGNSGVSHRPCTNCVVWALRLFCNGPWISFVVTTLTHNAGWHGGGCNILPLVAGAECPYGCTYATAMPPKSWYAQDAMFYSRSENA